MYLGYNFVYLPTIKHVCTPQFCKRVPTTSSPKTERLNFTERLRWVNYLDHRVDAVYFAQLPCYVYKVLNKRMFAVHELIELGVQECKNMIEENCRAQIGLFH